MKVQTVAEQLFFTTVYLSGSNADGATWTGTGFVYAVPTNKGEAHFLVSNKHVLEPAARLTARMVRGGPDGAPLWGEVSSAEWLTDGDACLGHPDPAIDVAVVPFSPILNVLHGRGETAFYRSFSPDHVPTRDGWQELDALERVLFVGYPSGLYDTANMTPIAREGMTATPVGLDYQGKPAFVIDGAVYPGSSGSPVVLFDRGMYQRRDGGTVVGNRFLLLGVLAAVHIRDVEAQVIETTSLVARISQEIGLGIVFRSGCIDACVDEMLTRVGLSRAGSASGAVRTVEITAADEDLEEGLGKA